MFPPRISDTRTREDRGAILVEYAALFIFVVVVAITALTAFGVSVVDLYTDSAERYADAAQRNVG